MSTGAGAAREEEWPDGTYGGARPPRAPRPDPAAADHVQELIEALAGWRVGTHAEIAARGARRVVPPSQLITGKGKS